jgi:hypothetical protein
MGSVWKRSPLCAQAAVQRWIGIRQQQAGEVVAAAVRGKIEEVMSISALAFGDAAQAARSNLRGRQACLTTPPIWSGVSSLSTQSFF